MGSSGAVSAVPPRLDVVTVLGGWWGPPPLPAATLRLHGVTTQPGDVEDLRDEIRDGAATNAFVSAFVPPGSFRGDIAAPGTYRFEIVATGVPRSFNPAPKPAPRRGSAAGGGSQP